MQQYFANLFVTHVCANVFTKDISNIISHITDALTMRFSLSVKIHIINCLLLIILCKTR